MTNLKHICKPLTIILLLSFLSTSCYDDYAVDYISGVYINSQKPLRTVVARDVMEFQFGVSLAGVRSNDKGYSASYMIDTTLMSPELLGASGLKLLPEEYYTLSDENYIDIPVGYFMGKITVTLNKEKFTADSLSTMTIYALPVRLLTTTADSILTVDGVRQDFAVIGVKYISTFHGWYYIKGTQTTLSGSITYSNKDLSQNKVIETSTLALNKIKLNSVSIPNYVLPNFELEVNDDHTVDVSSTTASIINSSATYNSSQNTFYLDITFDKNGERYREIDTLVLRQDPELDLRYEEW